MIKILCIGKIKEKYLCDLIDDYKGRINKYHKLEVIELNDSNIDEEKDLLLKNINKDDYVICMDICGDSFDSIGFKNKLENLFNNSYKNIVFVVGGSYGIHNDVKRICNERMSFSSMTFPHGLFRGLLLEQIYRSFKIMNNESYHK